MTMMRNICVGGSNRGGSLKVWYRGRERLQGTGEGERERAAVVEGRESLP